ncbi:ESX-1 secretion-associated protein [Mycobacterium lacus]|uniref:Uncharacterized protein n=1 Tax=Mycobacterium lacus TaxID=169765 RepID=A0A1X1Y6U6_9MYCO|nr:ESX-1 secretion-associated protein [Mycobacterium lacus]MCV7125661.1 ESX-1 secretion-associated protein [Mycobacterium lacus]ORW06779.1 hypothetical protein AWC15_21060 [Mycobacterium lacus]BBX96278.1 hypothetical protein MLAC_15720 [Mycobacterium lacus]
MTGSVYVVPDFLSVLERTHENVSVDIRSAIGMVTGMSQSVSTTHGSFCSLFNQILAEFESIRSSTGDGLQQVANQLAEKLHRAAGAYVDTDEGTADMLSNFFR